MSERTSIDMNEYMDNLKPLKHDPIEEEYWQEHYQYVIDNADIFSEAYVEWNRRQIKVSSRYRKHVESKRPI